MEQGTAKNWSYTSAEGVGGYGGNVMCLEGQGEVSFCSVMLYLFKVPNECQDSLYDYNYIRATATINLNI